VDVPEGRTGIVTGSAVPYEFFITKGKGESPYQVHAGSYHRAMADAGIELGNLVAYTSILPPIAKEIPAREGIRRIGHGDRVMLIQAVSHVEKGVTSPRRTAGILFGWLYKGGIRQGGLVCEEYRFETPEETKENLEGCLKDVYVLPSRHRKSFEQRGFELKDKRFIYETVAPEKNMELLWSDWCSSAILPQY